MIKTYIILIGLTSIQILGHDTGHESAIMPQESLDENSNLVETLNDIGYRLMMIVSEHNNSTNVVMSPAGVTALLATVLLGSIGNTYNEIADILGFSRDILENRKRHEDLGRLFQALDDTSAKTILADAVFVDQRTRLRALYRDYLKRIYKGEALHTNFADEDMTRLAINEWVKVHTEDEIVNFLGENLPSHTQLVLLNALYFKGQWARPFIPKLTTKMVFQSSAKEITTDFMINLGEFRYISSHEHELRMVALPYNGNTTMYVLKPRNPKTLSLSKLLQNLDYTKIDKLISRMTSQDCVVRFPKMNLVSKLNLEKYIKLIGAPSVFVPGKANFALMVEGATEINNKSEISLISRMNTDEGESRQLRELLNKLPNPGLHIDSIIQQVKINIDEYGTTASAATVGVLARTAEMFYADSPFLMFIRNEKTKLVTFSALVYDPTAS